MTKRNDIRQQCRQQRRALDPSQQLDYALQFAEQLSKTKPYKTANNIACYFSNDGELDLSPLMDMAWGHNKNIYVPVLQAPFVQRLLFARYDLKTPLVSNKFGIAEPAIAAKKRVKPQFMDIILAPLVAFDRSGNRIGMGGGYYDRSLSFLQQRQHWHRPVLIGCAYDFQERKKIKPEKWDVNLAYVCTNHEIIKIS